jgi:CrcB protein
MTAYLLVAVGGALGSVARYWMATAVATLFETSFPLGTLLINIIGSGIIGSFAALTGGEGRLAVSPDIRIFVMVGLCGGFTTFSSFSLQTLDLLQAGELLRAGLYILLSVALCLVSVWLGYLAATNAHLVATGS